MSDFKIAVVTNASPLTIREPGATTSMHAAYLVGDPPSLTDPVLYTQVNGKTAVFSMTVL